MQLLGVHFLSALFEDSKQIKVMGKLPMKIPVSICTYVASKTMNAVLSTGLYRTAAPELSHSWHIPLDELKLPNQVIKQWITIIFLTSLTSRQLQASHKNYFLIIIIYFCISNFYNFVIIFVFMIMSGINFG